MRTRQKVKKYIGFILTLLLLALLPACQTNPVTGEDEFVLVSQEQAWQMGDQSHPNIVQTYDGEYNDKELQQYLGSIVQRLHSVSHVRTMPVDFSILNTSVVNAFALPGHVYATRGFLAELDNEAQFAAVMGHELAHVAAGHVQKRMTNQLLTSLTLSAASGVMGNSSGANTAMSLAQAGSTLLQLQYSREQERQADRVGTYYMARAGWNPQEAISMQELLHSMNESEQTVLDKYLSTHPPEQNRIQNIREVISQKDLASAKTVEADGVFKGRWDKRLAELRKVDKAYKDYDKGQEQLSKKNYKAALQSAEKALNQRSDQAQFYCLKGDALLGLGKLDESRAAYQKAAQKYPNYAHAQTGLGMVALQQEKYGNAEEYFAEANKTFPSGYTPVKGLGMARYYQGNYKGALEALQSAASAQVKDPALYYALGVSYQKTGNLTYAYQAYQVALSQGLTGERASRARAHMQKLKPAVERRSQ